LAKRVRRPFEVAPVNQQSAKPQCGIRVPALSGAHVCGHWILDLICPWPCRGRVGVLSTTRRRPRNECCDGRAGSDFGPRA